MNHVGKPNSRGTKVPPSNNSVNNEIRELLSEVWYVVAYGALAAQLVSICVVFALLHNGRFVCVCACVGMVGW